MKKIYLHPLPIRIWHWINAIIILLLIITGIQLRFSAIDMLEYSWTVSFHKYLGFALTGSFLFWLFYCTVSGAFTKHYVVRLRDIQRMPIQALYYMYGLFRGKPNPFTATPEEKFNALQKLAYLTIMLAATPIIIVSGILLSDIVVFLVFIKALGGLRCIDAIHVVAGYFFIIYLLIHIYMATLGERVYSYIKTMVTGYEIIAGEDSHEEKGDH